MLLINPFIFGVFYYLPVPSKTTNVKQSITKRIKCIEISVPDAYLSILYYHVVVIKHSVDLMWK